MRGPHSASPCRAQSRGRELGEIPDLIEDELLRLGAPPEAITRAASEVESIEQALAWSKPGDLLLLLVHENRQAVLDVLGVG